MSTDQPRNSVTQVERVRNKRKHSMLFSPRYNRPHLQKYIQKNLNIITLENLGEWRPKMVNVTGGSVLL
uniref:Uncharacterized protein n=1 Tax=Parascaris univalens TaxID=6257 RepID=A0A915AJJ9_PARUN